MKTKSLLLLFVAAVMVSCAGKQSEAQNEGQAQQPEMPPVGTITAYCAAVELGDSNEKFKPGDVIADNYDPFAPKVEESGESYVFTWEPEYDDEEVVKRTFPKSSVTVKTIKAAWLAVADVENGALFESKDGQNLRIFRSNSNGHTYPDIYGEDGKLTAEQQKKCLVMSVSHYSEYDKTTYYSYYLLPEQDGFVGLYEKMDGRLAPLIAGEFAAPYEWIEKNRGEAYDAQGNLLVDMDILEMLFYETIAWVAEENAIYLDGKMYYRK